LHSSFLEVFMEKYFAKYLLTIYGIISVLVLYFILICISIYGVSKLEIDFRQSYFISDDAYIKQYITK
jgi:Na+-transporting methylmalonyl-CoA/oxaloacetate decarboxylase gamma subunit